MQNFQQIINFIKETFKEPDEFIPLHAPVFPGNEKKYLAKCIDSTFVSYVGEFVTRFEEEIAKYTGAKYAVATVNGTTALQVSLIVAGLKQGEEVITSPLTFAATANAIVHAGGNPVFVDCEEQTLGLDPLMLEEFLNKNCELRENICVNKTSGKRIAACVPVHIFGHPCQIEKIINICNKWNITVIEDAAESLGSFVGTKHTGTFGMAAILSFNGNKIVTTGGGGMIITNDEAFAARAKYLTTTAKKPHPYEFFHTDAGFNFRMPNINAAVGVAQMENITIFLENKRTLAMEYKEFFNALEISFIAEKQGNTTNFWLNCIFMPDRIARNKFLEFSNSNNVMSRPAWVIMNKLPMYQTSQKFSVAEKIENTLVNIPSSVRLF
ncbi:MAG: LegC family aminotransferase [Bacteroidia bacterium]|nr:LegC family aminotransferase [Bacteroidia bacterium]